MAEPRATRAARGTRLAIVSGSAAAPLADAVARAIGTALVGREIARFPDGECRIRILDSLRGEDAYILQPTSPPVDENLMELLLLGDACRRAGAARLTAVIPYLGYARQDRRATGREPVGARLVADLLETGGFGRVVAIDLHSAALEGFFGRPLEHLTAVPLLAEALRRSPLAGGGVVVAPDLGAARLADRFGRLLDMPVAIVHKSRLSGRAVSTHGVTGNVEGRRPVIVDDMISTGGTIEAAARALAAAGSLPVAAVAATHGLFVDDAARRLTAVGPLRLIVTDTVPRPEGLGLPVEIVNVAPLLGQAIQHLNENRSLADLLSHG